MNYGGRITDAQDIRIADSILGLYYCEEAVTEGFSFSEDGLWKVPGTADIESLETMRAYIKTMPTEASPTVFGLHENANVTFQKNTTAYMINTVLSLQSAGGGAAGKSPDEVADEIAADLEERMPQAMNLDDAHPTTFAKMPDGNINALSNCLSQEIEKFNKMLGYLKATLTQLRRSIKGLVVMSEELEIMYTAFLNGQVPANWTGACTINRPCAQQYVGKSQSCMVLQASPSSRSSRWARGSRT